MENRSKYLLKNAGILTISNFSSKILTFFLVPLYTSVLSTEDVGKYDLIITTISLLIPILTVNISDAVMRFSMDKTKAKEEIAVIGLRFVCISIFAASAIVFLLNRFPFFHGFRGLEILFILYFSFNTLNSFLIQFAKGLEKIGDMGVAGVIGTGVVIISNILFLLFFKWGLLGFFFAGILGQAIPSIYLFIRVKLWIYLRDAHINKPLQKEMVRYSSPLIATTVGWWVNNASDKYVVSALCGIGANGLLSISYKIPSVINTLHGIFMQAWQITAIKEYEGNDSPSFYGRTFAIYNVLLAATCSCLIALSKPVGKLIYQKEFFPAWQYVPFLLISCVINSASGFCGTILSAKKETKPMMTSAIYGATANIVMNIGFVYLMGIQGATIATLLASCIIYIVRKKAVNRTIVITDYWVVVLNWLLLVIQAVFAIYTSFWWAEAILMAVMLFLNWKQLREVIALGIRLKNSSGTT